MSFSPPDLEEGLPSFQSGFNENSMLVFPGPAPASAEYDWTIGVYPNPYRAGSLFDNPDTEMELGRKIWFTGLPPRSRIQVFNLVGELVKTLHHDDPTSGQEPWDILSEPVRAIATGLYIYAVEDLETGEAVRIFTGAVMPAGLDTVAMQEDVQIEDRNGGDWALIPAGLKAGANRRLASANPCR